MPMCPRQADGHTKGPDQPCLSQPKSNLGFSQISSLSGMWGPRREGAPHEGGC
jgi:hypothetical protein